MVLNTCECCGKKFTINRLFKSHMNRKTPCIAATNETLKHHQCNRCDTRFQSKSNLMAHLNRKFPCALKNPQAEEIELHALFEKLKDENELLNNEILKQDNEILKLKNDLLDKNINNTTNNNNNTNNTNTNSHNTTNNNITIHMYGKEDLDHITDTMYGSCFKQVKRSVERLFMMKHFSKQMQNNHNLYISNMRDAYMMVFKSGRWDIVNKTLMLDKMYYDTKDNLSNAFDRMREEGTLDPQTEQLYSWFVDEAIEEDKEEEMKRVSTDQMACMAYNNRKYPMELKKKMDKKADKKADKPIS